jgi:hypothetical protein
MASEPTVKRMTTGRRGRRINARSAGITAHEYCLRHYGTSYCGGTPQRLVLPAVEMWIVPVVLTSPGSGTIGDVGIVAVNAMSGEVMGATPRVDVRAAGTRLATERRHDLDTAFRRARKT